MSVTFTNERVLKLIEIYKNHELLWDTSNRDSKDRVKKNDAWEDIAKAMNVPRREIEVKMHTLRSQFTREKKKFALVKKNGRGDSKYTSWFAYEPMKFLLKLDESGIDNSDMQAQQNSNDTPEPFHTENFHVAEPVHYESTDTTTRPASSKSHNSRKRTISYDEKSDGDDAMLYHLKHFGSPQPKTAYYDEFDIYAQYVASELRETKDLHSVLMAKHHINNILFNARIGKYRREKSTACRRGSIKSEHESILDGLSNHDD